MRLADRNALSAFAAAHHTKGGNRRTEKLRARFVVCSLAALQASRARSCHTYSGGEPTWARRARSITRQTASAVLAAPT
eukprot:scaffold19809_cov75-Phaeocystis_antarctica.AAC.2